MITSIATAIDELKTALPAAVVIPDTVSEYEAAVARPWSQTCWTQAAAYIYLSNIQELTQALAIVKKTATKFGIRTTGHNPNVGLSSADLTGIVLDISRFQSKELGPDGIARIGSGNTWGEMYTWLEEQKLSAIGGRDKHVGLGGFLLGGGMGAFPNLHGVGSDGIKNFEIMLADGSPVNANANVNADLYCSLKGGGSNFGIVTRFDLEIYTLINVQYTINLYSPLYSPEDYVEIVKATIAVQEAMENDPKIGLFTNFNKAFVAVGLLYADTPTERPPAFAPFCKLGSLMTTVCPVTNGTLLSLAEAMDHLQESQKRAISTITTKISQELYEEVYNIWTKTCKSLPTDCVLHYTIQPMGIAGVDAGKDRGENIMGRERIPQCWWVFTCEWPKDGSDDTAAQNAVNTMAESVQSWAREKGLLLDYLCMAFAKASQRVLRSYGPDNIKRMQDTAAKYDPESVFQKLQNDGFLLRNNT